MHSVHGRQVSPSGPLVFSSSFDVNVSIQFTQFLRPNGRTTPITIDRPPAIEARADTLYARGYRFEAEVLTTGHVSLTVVDRAEGVDLEIEVVPNGPKIPEAVDLLVNRAYENLITNGG